MMSRKGEWKPEETGYAERKISEAQASADVKVAGITMAGNTIREFISVAKSNPIVGVLLTIAATDLLYTAKILSPQGKSFMYTAVAVAFGVSVTVEILETGEAFISAITGGGTAPPNPAELIQPVATTIVENPPPPPPATRGGGIGQLASLIPAGAAL